MDALYSPQILSLAASVPFLGPLPQADVVATATSRICGSRLRLWVRFAGPAIAADAPFDALAVLAPVRDWPARHGAVMLPFEAALKAFAERTAAAGPSGTSPSPAPERAGTPSVS